ncbi:MAG: amidohydrolase [Acidobacteria bacterium]|nr:MAG: amidohydrolase [Acidobacteriota bacterium]
MPPTPVAGRRPLAAALSSARRTALHTTLTAAFLAALLASAAPAQQDAKRLARYQEELLAQIDARAKLTQEMVDSIFSFGELGFQEVETSRYVTAILEQHGFVVERGVAGMPTAWVARWGSGEPVISFGSDIDGIPKSSQKPGVAYHDPIVEGAPGHGEGHNSGQAVNVVAAIALKELMQRERIPGTLMLWPGVAEEQLGSKAFFVRAGLFEDVDLVFFTHVADSLSVSWGEAWGSGLVSVEYTFRGKAAHGAGAPWLGKSALDAVELMNTGWNYRREHLRLPYRLHYVITNGGDQPNVVPPVASVWYYYRELDYEHIKALFDLGEVMAGAAAAMSDTSYSSRVLGAAWPRHFNKVIAETMQTHIERVGLPEWSDDDVALAVALQREMGFEPDPDAGPYGGVHGLRTDLGPLQGPIEGPRLGGGSDDIGDIAWNVPTVTLRFPANFNTGGGGHHWSSAVAMATPIAHKGSLAGAKVMALTALDFFLDRAKVEQAWAYFRDEQTAKTRYQSFLREQDTPAIHLNERIMGEYREAMRPYYYDPSKYDTYLEQLGIDYPTVRVEVREGATSEP